jgi:hypothetical protein
MTGARRSAIFGPEPWAGIAGVSWSHFDRWFAMVAVSEFDADLDALRVALEQRLRDWLHAWRPCDANTRPVRRRHATTRSGRTLPTFS